MLDIHRPPAALGLLLGIACALLLPSRADASAQLSFIAGQVEIACDETGWIDLGVDAGAIDLRGLSVVLEFDPTVITPVGVDEGFLLAGDACPSFVRWIEGSAAGDSMSVDAAGLGCSVSGPGSLLRLYFRGVADGISPVHLRRVRLRTGSNLPIATTALDGALAVSCPVDILREGWGPLKSRFR